LYRGYYIDSLATYWSNKQKEIDIQISFGIKSSTYNVDKYKIPSLGIYIHALVAQQQILNYGDGSKMDGTAIAAESRTAIAVS
jgi:hypothetical protein